MMAVTSAAGTAYLSGAYDSFPSFFAEFMMLNPYFCVYYFVGQCLSCLFVIFLLAINYLTFFDLRLLMKTLVSSNFLTQTCHTVGRFRIMVFNATFNNISVISWWSVFLVKETGNSKKNTDLLQVTDKLSHEMLYRVHLTLNGVRTRMSHGLLSIKC